MPGTRQIPPFAKILPWVIAGILAGNWLPGTPWYYPAIGTAACCVCGWVWRQKDIAWIYAGAAVLLFAMSVTLSTATREVMPHGQKLVMALRIDSRVEENGNWLKADATVDKFRAAGEPGTAWQKSGEKVVIRFDTDRHISVGERLIATGRAGSLGTEEYAGYVKLMERRGYSAAVWVGRADSVIMLPGRSHTPGIIAARLQSRAKGRFDRLDLRADSGDIAKAMALGVRNGVSRELRDSYAAGGASHLLAVSGLHVGIVAVLINILLFCMPIVRHGHIIKNAVAITAIWSYAMVTGLSPSVLRSAMMFSGGQLALASSRRSASVNILLATATVMLLLNPGYLFDISFQMSFAAVAVIFMFFRPLYGLVRTRFKLLNILWGAFIIGMVSSLATAPLASYYFGRISLIGPFINPAVVLTAHITILFSLLWVIAPLGFMNGLFSAVINFSAGLQNGIVAFSASKNWAYLDLDLSKWQVATVYIAIFAAWHFLVIRRKRNTKPELE